MDSSTGALSNTPQLLTPPAAGGCAQGGSAVAVSPDGHNVYLGTVEDASGGSCTGSDAATTEIVHYIVGSGGALTQANLVDTGGLIGDIAITSDGASLFAAESSDPGGTPAGSDDLKEFTIGSGGSLSGGTVYTGWTDPGAIALSPSHSEVLTVSKAGSGSGSVHSADGKIDCGTTCSHAYAAGTRVTLTAAPATGSKFTGWSGGGCSGTSTCEVTLNSKTTVTATFTAKPDRPSLSHTVSTTKRTATFTFSAKHATRYQCSLVKKGKPASYAACTSPKKYSNLTKGDSYMFFVRGLNSTGPGPATTFGFTI